MAARVPSLTGVRTVAALSVVATHAAFWVGDYTDDYPGRLFARFEVGVPVFFVLSGYLLFVPWVRAAADGTPAPDTGRYLWHRARRVLPAYWLTVIAVYLLYGFAPPGGVDSATGTGWWGFVRNLTLTQVYGPGHLHGGLTQMWSLAAEVVFYLVLPPIGWVLVVGLARRSWRPDLLIGGLSALLLVSPVWIVVVAGSDGLSPTARLWAPSFFGWFVGGMLLAACAPLVRRWNTTGWLLTALAAFVLSGTAIAGEPTITPTTASATLVKHVLYLVIAVGVVGPLTADDQTSWWTRLCASRPMVWLGETSYELFLVHVIVLEYVMALLGYPVFTGHVVPAFVVTVLISVPVAWALHRGTRPLWRARTPGTQISRR
ncbi:acyltransferase [Gordonia sp. NB41Y]|uniref:acyltransferase family protein n=1 Tax=Gordonia sp. NB41Y TaxID=875808 RepID=UPI0006B1D4E2|nr:acyltransferase [Gordonia sp. NB41Y]KOY49681.1 acyltransferase [Gordonia sp. NB41Y]WLP92696.1 acyltransferase [Gordonia sp. NB41Y]